MVPRIGLECDSLQAASWYSGTETDSCHAKSEYGGSETNAAIEATASPSRFDLTLPPSRLLERDTPKVPASDKPLAPRLMLGAEVRVAKLLFEAVPTVGLGAGVAHPPIVDAFNLLRRLSANGTNRCTGGTDNRG